MTGATDPLAGSDLEVVIGLEVHTQLDTKTKMFCRCESRFGAEPNYLTCPVCLALPGALPYINEEAVRLAVRIGKVLNSTIPEVTKFDRKNYFYPDLPKGYQISQFDMPICDGGSVEYITDGDRKTVRLVRAHLEEDAGKSVHADGGDESLVDLNRAGTPLLEIVTEPDLRSPREAVDFLRSLRRILLYLEVSDCNMEEGSFRADCNVSIRPRGAQHLETRAEIKNLNSFTFIENAILCEMARQRKIRESGGQVVQETRLYDPDKNLTRSMRGKEEAHDYRYFPEPDLAPLELERDWVERVTADMPELPLPRQERYRGKFGLSEYQAEVLTRDRQIADFFEECAAGYDGVASIANWLINALTEELNARNIGLSELGVSPRSFIDLVAAVDSGRISKAGGKDLFKALARSEKTVDELIREEGLEQNSDDSFIRDIVQKVIAENPGPVSDVKAGKKNSINFLVGQVMRHSKGKANPGMAAGLLNEMI